MKIDLSQDVGNGKWTVTLSDTVKEEYEEFINSSFKQGFIVVETPGSTVGTFKHLQSLDRIYIPIPNVYTICILK